MAAYSSSHGRAAFWLALAFLSVCLLGSFVPLSWFLRHHPTKYEPVTTGLVENVEAPANVLDDWMNFTPGFNASNLSNGSLDKASFAAKNLTIQVVETNAYIGNDGCRWYRCTNPDQEPSMGCEWVRYVGQPLERCTVNAINHGYYQTSALTYSNSKKGPLTTVVVNPCREVKSMTLTGADNIIWRDADGKQINKTWTDAHGNELKFDLLGQDYFYNTGAVYEKIPHRRDKPKPKYPYIYGNCDGMGSFDIPDHPPAEQAVQYSS